MKERQSLSLGSSNCSPSIILPLGGSSGSPPSPNTPVSLDPLPASSWPLLEQRGSALRVWSPSWPAHFETFPLWAPGGSVTSEGTSDPEGPRSWNPVSSCNCCDCSGGWGQGQLGNGSAQPRRAVQPEAVPRDEKQTGGAGSTTRLAAGLQQLSSLESPFPCLKN